MEDFEKRRNEYFDRIREDGEILGMLTNNPNNNPDVLKIILMPKTPKELEFAEAIISFFTMTYNMMTGEYESNIIVEDSSIVKLYIEIINALKVNDERKVEEIKFNISNSTNPREFAMILYDFYSIAINYPIEAKEHIAKECGFDINDGYQEDEFLDYFEKAQVIANGNVKVFDFKTQSIEDSEQINHFIAAMHEFRIIYEERRKGQEK